jgi:murein DD-endopeptidase MepM/ murein hydrolase activator NlpD
MLQYRHPSTRSLCAIACAAAACLGIAVSRAAPSAHAASPSASTLQQQIGAAKNRASGLSGTVNAASGRVARLDSGIAGLQHRISTIQASLDYERHQLLTTRALELAAHKRLQVLQAKERRAEAILTRRLVSTYETPPPDIINVILEARGFADMLERLSFARRIQNQDTRVTTQVRAARSAVAEQAIVLGALEARQQALTNKIVAQRTVIYNARLKLVEQRLTAARQRSAAASSLASTRRKVAGLQHELIKLQVQQAAQQQQAQSSSTPAVSSTQTSSSGGFTFPLPRGSASPPGTWSLDQGVDISAPANTPELAVGAGTIVLHGIGGFGPWAPVLHLDSGGYVYYGHAGPGNELPIGTHVSAGQPIAEIGAGIVGISTGPHLEIGFSDASGTPLGSQTAPQMMSLLQASY